MTAVVGIKCQNGVVIGTDSSMTSGTGTGFRTVELPCEKLHVIGEHIVFAGTGQVGLGRRFVTILDDQWTNKGLFKSGMTPLEMAKAIVHEAVKDFEHTGVRLYNNGKIPFGALVGFPVRGEFHLCEFAFGDLQPDLKHGEPWCVSMGSTQYMTDPFLALMKDVFWPKAPPPLHLGMLAATWTLDQAVALNVGGVDAPVQMGVLERGERGRLLARRLADEELGQHRQCIEELVAHMRAFPGLYQVPPEDEVPELEPEPESALKES